MIKSFLFFVCVAYGQICFGQLQNPVNWTFSSKKINATTYEVHVTANIEDKWHIYSQKTPDGGPLPTKITYNKNPLVKLEGEAKETGKIITKFEEVFEVNVKYFDGSASFVQTVKLKSNVKTSISGTIAFMACNDEQCLPPASVPFTIQLN